MFQARRNKRGITEAYLERHHSTIQDIVAGNHGDVPNDYLCNNTPEYPKGVELHISKVSHVTDIDGLTGIMNSSGFKPVPNDERRFLWWSLAVEEADIKASEQRFLQAQFPTRTTAQENWQEPFLEKFTTSPAFLKSSRYGNFKFTFKLADLLTQYSKQFCAGFPPKFKVYETVLYKQEVLYTVVVHSPYVQVFGDDSLSLKTEESPVEERHIVWYDRNENAIVWRPEAMCNAFEYSLVKNADENLFTVEPLPFPKYYAWDNVALAFHVDKNKELLFAKEQLAGNLTACEMGFPNLGKVIRLKLAQDIVEKFSCVGSE